MQYVLRPKPRSYIANYAMKFEDVSIDDDDDDYERERLTILVFQRGRGGRHRSTAPHRGRPRERFKEDRRQTDICTVSDRLAKKRIGETQIIHTIQGSLMLRDSFYSADSNVKSQFSKNLPR